MTERHDQDAQQNEQLATVGGEGIARRTFVQGAAAAVAGATLLGTGRTAFAAPKEEKNWAARPPAGFTPYSAPGKVVKVAKAGSLQANKLYPNDADAKTMLERVMTELTSEKDVVAAVAKFVHPDDVVVVKVNGIALKNMGTNKELVIPFLEAMIKSGVKPEKITVLEQYNGFLAGTRITAQNVPNGVKVAIHANNDAVMDDRIIPGTGTRTKFVRVLTEATAAINFSLIKDHSICGYTGALKNMTHGCTINPHDFHVHHASPQIALLYSQDVIKSRVRLHIADGYKIMANGGPLWKQPQYVKAHEAVYASTDPVALDTIGWEIIEAARKEYGLKTLTDEKREPSYIKTAASLGLGIHERAKITLKEITV